MKIVVVADTHHNYRVLKNIVASNPNADLFIHLGDGENEYQDVKRETAGKQFIFIKGNNDFGTDRDFAVINVSGYKIFCTHGHRYQVLDGTDLLVHAAKQNNCKIALYGHTHVYQTKVVDDIYIMNPGSPDSPRNHQDPSYGIIQIDSSGQIRMSIIACSEGDHDQCFIR